MICNIVTVCRHLLEQFFFYFMHFMSHITLEYHQFSLITLFRTVRFCPLPHYVQFVLHFKVCLLFDKVVTKVKSLWLSVQHQI